MNGNTMSLRAPKDTHVAAVSVALLALVLMAGTYAGARGRQSIPGSHQLRIESSSPADLCRRLQNTGVRGRTLIVFDGQAAVSERDYGFRSLFPSGSPLPRDPVDETNYVAWLIHTGIARRAFVVLPPDRYSERAAGFSAAYNVFPSRYGYVRRMAGAPVTYTNAEKLDALRTEKALVIIHATEQDSYPAGIIGRWTNAAHADVVVQDWSD